MAPHRLEGIEQSIAETEMHITIERALMEQTPEIHRRPSAIMLVLQDTLRQKLAIRQDILEQILPREAENHAAE